MLPFFLPKKTMKFIDEVNIQVSSGNGGDGAVSFRREKFVPRGGPDGGNGGHGASVHFEATERLNTLIHFRGKKTYQAPHGEPGAGSQCDGKSGVDLTLMVPVGTIITDTETEEIIADLDQPGKTALLAKGGTGGLGNTYFKTSVNQTPRFASDG